MSIGARSALEDGLLEDGPTLDYGCGRGDDVRHLAYGGFRVVGWDPHFFPGVDVSPAAIVLLTYVLNTVENNEERRKVLNTAWQLATSALVVTVRLHWERRRVNGVEYRDGVVTGRDTFQHLYRNDELSSLLRDVTGVAPVFARPGVAYCFRTPQRRLRYVVARWTPTLLEQSVSAHDDLGAATRYMEVRGRPPTAGEVTRPTLPTAAWSRAVTKGVDGELVAAAARRTTLETIGMLALERFHGPLRWNDLPPTVKEDIRAFLGSFKHATWRAERLLRQLRDQAVLRQRMRASVCGKNTASALYVHQRALPQAPLLLRIYEECGAMIAGRPETWNIAKLHHDAYKVSWLHYPDFDDEPHPRLSGSYTVDLSNFKTEYRTYDASPNRPLLHRKHEFLGAADPRASLYKRLTGAEVRAGLFMNPEVIGREQGWQLELERCGVELRGHRLVKRAARPGQELQGAETSHP